MKEREESPDLFTDATSSAVGHADAAEPKRQAGQPPSMGTLLRTTRETMGRSLADCARELHLPVRVLERLENDDFGESSQFVFVRGVLSGYARLLGLPADRCTEALRAVAPAEQPVLVSVARTSPLSWLLRRYGTAATYIVLTATIAVPLVVLGLRGGLERPVARIVSLDQTAPSVVQSGAPETTMPSHAAPERSAATSPFRASMTPFAAMGLHEFVAGGANATTPLAPIPPVSLASGTEDAGHELTIAASADCWFEITDADGARVDSGMLHPGDSRTWQSTGGLHVTLGNADGATVTRDGEPFALDPHQHANVARFVVFADATDTSGNN